MLLLGYGYVARRLSRIAQADGWAIAGTVRDAAKSNELRSDGVTPIYWEPGRLDRSAVMEADAILVSTPPAGRHCPSLGAMRELLLAADKKPSWVGYLSTNGVYGDYGGEWVDEGSTLRAKLLRAQARIAAEEGWRAFGDEARAPVVIFRLPGIYGPGRSALDAVRGERARRIFKEGQVFSRAHVDDIAAALHASLRDPSAGDLFNIADDEPAPPQDVVDYACKLLGVAPPPLVAIDSAGLSEMEKSFYADCKRVSNRLMKERLLPRLSYPTYRDGLRALFSAGY